MNREVDQRIRIAWITHNPLKNNGGNMWQEILTFGKFLLYCDIIILWRPFSQVAGSDCMASSKCTSLSLCSEIQNVNQAQKASK